MPPSSKNSALGSKAALSFYFFSEKVAVIRYIRLLSPDFRIINKKHAVTGKVQSDTFITIRVIIL